MACQSRGRIQAKFNGGLFTQPLRYGAKPRMVATQVDDKTWISHEDDRLWGRRFTYQNQRLLYWPLLMSGDGELYPVFPFRRFGLGLGTKDIVDWTMQHRTLKNAFGYKCWTQDQIHWAYAGNAAEASEGLVHRYRKHRVEVYLNGRKLQKR